jgi:hypothetical protein
MLPMPHMKGSFTLCEKAVATAASKALPPLRHNGRTDIRGTRLRADDAFHTG